MHVGKVCALVILPVVAVGAHHSFQRWAHDEAERRRPRQVTFEVDVSGPVPTRDRRAVVTLSIGGYQTSQTMVEMPWQQTQALDPGQVMVLSAQMQGAEGGIRVTLLSEGRLLSESSSTAPYGVAYTSAVCCERVR